MELTTNTLINKVLNNNKSALTKLRKLQLAGLQYFISDRLFKSCVLFPDTATQKDFTRNQKKVGIGADSNFSKELSQRKHSEIKFDKGIKFL